VIMGHEAAGDVISAGSRVSDITVGMRVTFDSTLFCGTCFYCRRGEVNFCEQRRVLGVSADEYRQNGAFAEYVTVPARGVYPLPEDVGYLISAVAPLSEGADWFRRLYKNTEGLIKVILVPDAVWQEGSSS
jgi:L-iditol 2-dehydrogenase